MADHPLLRRQLRELGLAPDMPPQDAATWHHFLELVVSAYGESERERSRTKQSHELSLQEIQERCNRQEEAQRVAGLGYWSFDIASHEARWSEECFRIGDIDSSAVPGYRKLLHLVQKRDRTMLRTAIRGALHDACDFAIEFRLHLERGGTRWVRAIGKPVRGQDGRVARLHGIALDITNRKKVEMRQSIEHTITRLMAESDSPDETLPKIIRAICETVGWACGAYWELNRARRCFERTMFWTTDSRRIRDFYAGTRQVLDLPACKGPIGRVLESRQPAWIRDIAVDAEFPRAQAATEAGLRGAFALPVEARNEILGVLEFFSRRTQDADPEMLQSAHFIGRHIGQHLERKQAELALRESEAHFRALVEHASDAFFVHDSCGRLIDVNQHACNTLGYTREELLAKVITDIDVDLDISDFRRLENQVVAGTPLAIESRHRRKDGSVFPVEIRMGPIRMDGQDYLLSLVRDVTERKQMQEHIQHLAYHDALTDLPNRTMFNRHLRHAITQAQRYNKRLAVLFVDLDRFKLINDTLGHEAGDSLLQEMGRRISACLRSGDVVARYGGPEDLVARLGGDEFVVLIEEVTDSTHVSQVAHKILNAMVKEYVLEGQIVHMTASIGISMYPEDGRNDFTLMKHADIAMYRAKEKGKNTFQFYSAQMDAHSARLLALEAGLRRAIERNELVLYYQPKVDIRSGQVTGAEALVRWRHPDLGLVSPGHFIPLAEETGLIVPLSKWVLKEACQENVRWRELGMPPMRISVNLSARQFTDDNLFDETVSALEEIGMAPELLEFEITESMMMYNTDRTIQVLSELRKLGISVSIDDFGIGYSSLSHLKQFPINIIKMDRSFIKDVATDTSDAAIADAIIAMSKRLKVMVVAEGVETAPQLQFLRERDCDEIQGYYFSKPLPAEEFISFVLKHMEAASRAAS